MDSKMNKEEFASLENRIWKTYHSRIIAARNLLRKSKILDFHATIYTICLTLLSVFTLLTGDELIGYYNVFISIIVMGLVFYGNTMNYKDRYINMKENYLKLTDLYYKCVNERIKNNYDFESIYSEYSKLLATVENHSTSEYTEFLLSDKKNSDSIIPVKDIIVLYGKKIVFLIINILIFSIPVLLTTISFFKVI